MHHKKSICVFRKPILRLKKKPFAVIWSIRVRKRHSWLQSTSVKSSESMHNDHRQLSFFVHQCFKTRLSLPLRLIACLWMISLLKWTLHSLTIFLDAWSIQNAPDLEFNHNLIENRGLNSFLIQESWRNKKFTFAEPLDRSVAPCTGLWKSLKFEQFPKRNMKIVPSRVWIPDRTNPIAVN